MSGSIGQVRIRRYRRLMGGSLLAGTSGCIVPMNNTVGERREENGPSQADLADAVDVSRQTLNAAERERYDPSLELAFKLATHVDCQIEELLDPALETN